MSNEPEIWHIHTRACCTALTQQMTCVVTLSNVLLPVKEWVYGEGCSGNWVKWHGHVEEVHTDSWCQCFVVALAAVSRRQPICLAQPEASVRTWCASCLDDVCIIVCPEKWPTIKGPNGKPHWGDAPVGPQSIIRITAAWTFCPGPLPGWHVPAPSVNRTCVPPRYWWALPVEAVSPMQRNLVQSPGSWGGSKCPPICPWLQGGSSNQRPPAAWWGPWHNQVKLGRQLPDSHQDCEWQSQLPPVELSTPPHRLLLWTS